MDELDAYCARMLGEGEEAAAVAENARAGGRADRLTQLAHAVKACRARARSNGHPSEPATPSSGGGELASAVAAELSQASARLSQGYKEVLALRELIGLGHAEIAAVIGIDESAPAQLLAGARLRLRSELRGSPMPAGDCAEWGRTLRTATLRQDREPVPVADDDWLVDHLGHCVECGQAHSAMLEGSACYRGWRSPEASAATVPATAATP
jgi:hypothetical protein